MSDDLNSTIKRLSRALAKNESLLRETAIKFEDLIVANESLQQNLEQYRAFRKYINERRKDRNSNTSRPAPQVGKKG